MCPENELFGTPRPPIKLIHDGGLTHAIMKGKNVLEDLEKKTDEIMIRHADADGFIGMSRSPSCGMSVGVKNLGRTIKAPMHSRSDIPSIDASQLKTKTDWERFLKRMRRQ